MQEGWGHHGLVDDWHQGPALFLRPAQVDHPRAGPVAENGRRLEGSYVLCGARGAKSNIFRYVTAVVAIIGSSCCACVLELRFGF